MRRSIHRAATFALLVLPITLGGGAAVAASAQAASAWSAPFTLPAAVGSGSFAENASGAQIAVTGTGPQVSSSTTGQTWSAPVTIASGGTDAAVALAANGRAVVVWHGGTATAPLLQASTGRRRAGLERPGHHRRHQRRRPGPDRRDRRIWQRGRRLVRGHGHDCSRPYLRPPACRPAAPGRR